MIAYIKGRVIEKDAQSIVVDNSGIGYEIFVPTDTSEAALFDQEVALYIYHAVKENAEELFGFTTLAAKRLFELLISVQGVGPKAALAILSLGSSDTVRNAIANSDASFIAHASGVGKKTAERVAVDLHDKVGASTGGSSTPQLTPSSSEALDALIALGFNLNDASGLLKDVPTDLPVSEQVRLALKQR